MKKRYGARFSLVLAAVFSFFTPATPEAANPSPTSGDLFEAVARMDGAIFDAFNARDLERLMSMFTEDLEFYDDGDSVGLNNYKQTKDDFQKMFANIPDMRRDLVPGTLEVYPIKGHGALEIGQHRFCHKENGKDDCGTFKFAMIWRKTGELWKLSRVISYGHKPPK
jgi:ketosteroid isomerase-like protein